MSAERQTSPRLSPRLADSWTRWTPGDQLFDAGSDAIAVLRVDLDAAPTYGRDHLPDCLTEAEAARACRMISPAVASAFTVMRAALRLTLAALADKAPHDIEIELSQTGRPSAPGTGYDFNLSHSGRIGLIALTKGDVASLGVDVEFARRVADMNDIASRYFAPDDVDYFKRASRIGSAYSEAAFFRGWVRLEAGLKADGAGLIGLGRTPRPELCLCDLPLEPFDDYSAALAFTGAPERDILCRSFVFPCPAPHSGATVLEFVR